MGTFIKNLYWKEKILWGGQSKTRGYKKFLILYGRTGKKNKRWRKKERVHAGRVGQDQDKTIGKKKFGRWGGRLATVK